MKFFWPMFFLLLTGCQSSMSLWSDAEEPVGEETMSDRQTNINSDDAEFIKIAKDLFVSKQYKQAYQIVSRLARRNNPEAHYLLGYMMYYGYGVKADKQQGANWIKKAADAGNRSAIEAQVMIQYNLTPDKKCPADSVDLSRP